MGPPPLDGNRAWRTVIDGEVVLHKMYNPRGGRREELRGLLRRLAPTKTLPTARARCATERRTVSAWNEAGFPAPADLGARFPRLTGPTRAVYQWIEAPLMLRELGRKRELPRPARDELLARFATLWSTRHGAAVDARRPDLVQEHGTFAHVFVDGERFVTFDHETLWTGSHKVPRHVAREVAGYVKSLAKDAPPAELDADLATLAAAYPRRELLEAALEVFGLSRGEMTRRADVARDELARRGTLSKPAAMSLLGRALGATAPARGSS